MEFTETFKQTGLCAFSPDARFLAVAVDYRLVVRDVHTLKVPTLRFIPVWTFWVSNLNLILKFQELTGFWFLITCHLLCILRFIDFGHEC